MAMMTSTYNPYTTSYRSSYVPSSSSMKYTSAYGSSSSSVPRSSVTPSSYSSTSKSYRSSALHSPVRRDSDSLSSRPPIGGRPLPVRPSHVSSVTTARRGRIDASLDLHGGYSTPLKGVRTDGYEKSERNYGSGISSTGTSRVAGLRTNFSSASESTYLTRTGSGLRDSHRDTSYKDVSYNDSAVDSEPKTVRRRSASVGAASRYLNREQLSKAQPVSIKKGDESEKENVCSDEKDDKISAFKTASGYDSNNNPSKPNSIRASGNNGQILGGTAVTVSSGTDDCRHRSTGQAASDGKSEKSQKDSPADILITGYRSSDRGATGLENLGNTCFMNSILQCLSNTQPLLEFCLDGKFSADINRKTSQLNGQMIKVYAQLMRSMWEASKSTSVAPTEFKSQISRVAKQFIGYNQHDAHEFLIYLLEGLHEDVNRVQEKKKRFIDCSNEVETISAAEKARMSWEKYIECDNSKIVDIFAGQLKSVLTCKECEYVSNTFDPFFVLSLPIKRVFTSL